MTSSQAILTEQLNKVGESNRVEAEDTMKIAQRLMIRAANLDRRLMSDLDWQQAMTYSQNVITGFNPNKS